MSNFKKYEIPINVLTPIHIGSIDKFNSKEYLFVNDKVYRINIVDFFNSLNESNKEKFIRSIQEEDFTLDDLYVDWEDLKKFSKYSLINKCSDYPSKNNVEIECNIKSLNKLYIPGSSIKGAIKTALFYNSIKLDEIPNIIDRVLSTDFHNIINEYFTSSLENSKIQYNIMRFLQISDSSNLKSFPHLHQLVKLETINTKKVIVPRNFATRYIETIPNSCTLQTEITTNYDKKFFEELNFDEEMEELLSIEKIVDSLVSFADSFIEFEIDFFTDFKRYELVKVYEKLMENNYYNKPLILLGSGTGMHAKTIYLKIVEYDKKNNTHYSENLTRLLYRRKNNTVFPKSRYITYENSMPLGWAQLDFSEYL